MVHVAGAVVAPGCTSCPPGSRVADAIEAAGGLTAQADAGAHQPRRAGGRRRARLRARGRRAGAAGGGGRRAAGDRRRAGGPGEPEHRRRGALDALPGVGPATAAAIIEHRGKVGAFTSVDQLLDVPGIGDAKLEALRDLVTV